MKYRDIIGFSKKKQKFVKKAITPTPSKPSITKKLKEEFGQLNEWTAKPPTEKRWSKKFDGERGITEFEMKGEVLNEMQIEIEDVQDQEAAVFDVIIQFKKTFEKSEWKKNRKINSIIKQLLKLESQLGNETGELE